jgi:hypothetical protein
MYLVVWTFRNGGHVFSTTTGVEEFNTKVELEQWLVKNSSSKTSVRVFEASELDHSLKVHLNPKSDSDINLDYNSVPGYEYR